MSKADDIFVDMCTDILENGSTTEGQKVRPHWEDGTPAYTIKRFGVCNRYDLREEFPAITLRRTALKSCMDEVLWIYQRKSNNVHDLHSHIWDEWADETGSIGKAYGYQVAQVSRYADGDYDQMDRVLKDLRENPYSRRIMTNLYTFADLSEMHLYPCAFNAIYNVTQEPGESRPTLNMLLVQRSQDVLAANDSPHDGRAGLGHECGRAGAHDCRRPYLRQARPHHPRAHLSPTPRCAKGPSQPRGEELLRLHDR